MTTREDILSLAEIEARAECARRDIDPDEICADGGITAWMVVDQERRHFAAAPTPPAAEAPGQEPVALTVDDVEQIIVSTESTESDAVWTRRMAKALHASLVSAPPTYADAEATEAVRAFFDGLTKGFITLTSGDGNPYIKISYRTLKDAQDAHGLLIAAILSLASPSPKGET